MKTLTKWKEVAHRTKASNEMVFNISKDWEKREKEIKELIDFLTKTKK